MQKMYPTPKMRGCACGCGRVFTPTGWEVAQGKGIYFSKDCVAKIRGDPPIEITCLCGCGRKRFVQASRVKEGNGKFYSRECCSKYHREHRPWISCAFPGCTNKFQIMPFEIKHKLRTMCDEHRFYNPTKFKTGEQHRMWAEKIDVPCDWCGEIKKVLKSELVFDRSRGRKLSFCNKKCRRKWHEATLRGENHPNYNPNKQFHYDGFTPKARERCRNFWGRTCFITGVHESENINPTGMQEALTCHHIDGNKKSLLIIPILRSEHNRIEGNVKNKIGTPDVIEKELLEKLISCVDEKGYTLDQYIAYLYTGIEKQTSLAIT